MTRHRTHQKIWSNHTIKSDQIDKKRFLLCNRKAEIHRKEPSVTVGSVKFCATELFINVFPKGPTTRFEECYSIELAKQTDASVPTHISQNCYLSQQVMKNWHLIIVFIHFLTITIYSSYLWRRIIRLLDINMTRLLNILQISIGMETLQNVMITPTYGDLWNTIGWNPKPPDKQDPEILWSW